MTFTSARLLTALVAALVVVSCATAGGAGSGKSVLKPSEVDKAFAELDKNLTFALTPEGPGKNTIEFGSTKIKKYDEFLKEAASVRGTVVVSRVVLDDLEALFQEMAGEKPGAVADYDVLGNAVKKKQAELKPEAIEKVRKHVELLDISYGLIKELPARAQTMSQKGQELLNAATAEVQKDPMGMMAVPGAMTDAIGQVTGAATDAPALLERELKVIKVLTLCGCSHGSKVLGVEAVSPSLTALYPENPFAAADSRVDHPVTGLADVDAFVAEVAALQGAVVLIDVLVKDVGKNIQTLAAAAEPPKTAEEIAKLAKALHKKKKTAVGDELAKLKQNVLQAKALGEVLAGIPARAKELAPKGQAIGASAAENALKTPAKMAAVPGALEASVAALAESTKKTAALVGPLKDMVGSLASIAP
ncbi:MAG: hypothetical protein Q8O67_13095 [Deltaproteobacteria bacterium]|nr:hypothetical protein [Deltaproteobacteria bacterium]